MPRGIPFKSEKERKEARRIYHRDWQRKNKDKRKAYLSDPEVKIKRREWENQYKAKRRKDSSFRDKEKYIKKKWYDRNKYQINKKLKERYSKDEEFKKKRDLYHQKWLTKNKDNWNAKQRNKYRYDEDFKSKIGKRNLKWRLSNKEYMLNYRERTKNQRNAYERNKAKNDPIFRIARTLRSRMRGLIKTNLKAGIRVSKNSTAEKNLGCNFEYFKRYIEKKWLYKMSWDNYGSKGWHIDHIIPAGMIDLTKKENQEYANNYKNLQPMWAKDNIKKNALIEKRFNFDAKDLTINNWIKDINKRLRNDLKFVTTKNKDKVTKETLVRIKPVFYFKN